MSLGAYTEHDVVKWNAIAEYAASLVELEAALPQLFTREGYEQFAGREGDKLTYRVRGRLPYRKYGFRNDRTVPIVFDEYEEATTDITWGGRIYQGARITDEQADFDLQNWEPILSAQAGAIAQGVIDDMAETIEETPFAVTVGGAEAALRAAIVEARRVLNRFRVPGPRYLIVGSDFEAAMLNDKDLTLAQNVGDTRAEGALSTAILGQHAGFTVVLDNTIEPDAAIAAVPTAFVQVSGAPGLPRGGVAASVGSAAGTSVRWIADYSQNTFENRSTVDTYLGSNYVRDLFLPKSALAKTNAPERIEMGDMVPHFVRAIKLTLGGESEYPEGAGMAGLIAETGISQEKAWVAPAAGGGAADAGTGD